MPFLAVHSLLVPWPHVHLLRPVVFQSSRLCCAGECSIPYARRLQSSGNPNFVPSDPSWYSFDHGSIHVIGYSTEIDFSPGSAQYKYKPPTFLNLRGLLLVLLQSLTSAVQWNMFGN